MPAFAISFLKPHELLHRFAEFVLVVFQAYLENIRVRGLKSIAIHVYTVFTAMLAVPAAAHGKGLTRQIRCIRSVFGKS